MAAYTDLSRFLKLSSRKVWLPVVVFVAGMIGVFVLLATGVVPGLPDAPLKPVTLYPSPQAAPVTLFLQPPAATLQAGAGGQLLALQFANNAGSTMRVEQITAEPHNCFDVRSLEKEPLRLAPKDVHVILYHLTAVPGSDGAACNGQTALTLRYSYVGSTPSGGAAPGRSAGPGGSAEAVPLEHERLGSLHGEGFVATSPILITTLTQLRFERFFRIASALLVPVLLAIATFLIQQFQTRKAEQQKAQELRLEVWKILFPIVNGHMNDHYIQMVRKMNDARAELGNSKTQANGRNVVASVMILRASQAALDENVGGFLFRTMPAESLSGDLTDWLWQYCRALLGDDWRQFDGMAAAVTRKDGIATAARKLDNLAAIDPTAMKCMQLLQTSMVQNHERDVLDTILAFVKQILEFENNRLWYPEWYRTAPVMRFSTLSLEGMDLPDDKKMSYRTTLEDYRNAVPPKCRG